MRIPTKAERQLAEAGNCTRCGQWARDRNSAGRCNDCHNLEYREYKAQRKAQIAAMPRCEACNRRGGYEALGVRLCGHHVKVAQNKLAGQLGIFGLCTTITAEMIQRAVKGG